MTIVTISEYNTWTHLFNVFGSPSFLQSWEWGEVQNKSGYEILRLGIYDDKNCEGIAQVIKIKARRGNMLFVPQGPIINLKTQSSKLKTIIHELLKYLNTIAKVEGFDFIRIAPILEDAPEQRNIFAELGFKTSPIYMHAERVWTLDITKSEEQLLKEMRKTTRYSIRKAEKENVIIEKFPINKLQLPNNTQILILQTFWSIYKQTAQREGFTPFSDSFIRHEYEEFNRHKNAFFLLGKIGDRYEAGALIVCTDSTAFYHQGASLHSKVPVAYLMQWEAIKEAKKRGCTHYNFWGTLQAGRTPKSWGGLTLFKQGFGGYQVDYVPTQDYIVNPLKYGISYLYEQYLKIKRGV